MMTISEMQHVLTEAGISERGLVARIDGKLWLTVRPETASALLANRCPRQRVLDKRRVHEYACLMQLGEWDVHVPDPILFCEEFKLANGQHRLAAVELSGVEQGFPVELVTHETLARIDCGRVRDATAQLKMSGRSIGKKGDTGKTGTIVRMLARLTMDKPADEQFTPRELQETFDLFKKELEIVVYKCRKSGDVVFSYAATQAALVLAAAKHPEKVKQFVDKVKGITTVVPEDNTITWRRRFLECDKRCSDDLIDITLLAFHGFVRGKVIDGLKDKSKMTREETLRLGHSMRKEFIS